MRILCEDHATLNETVLADPVGLGLYLHAQGGKSVCFQLFAPFSSVW